MGEHEVTSEDGKRKTSRFPTLKITGGPHGRTTHVLLDGEEVPAVTGVELRVDVNDAARARIAHIVDLDIEVEADVTMLPAMYIARGYRKKLVDDPSEPGSKMRVSESVGRAAHGNTEAEAILHLAYQLDDSLTTKDELKIDDSRPSRVVRILNKIRGGEAIVPW